MLAYIKNGKCFIFAGMRRYHAIKKLYEAHGEPGTVRALVFSEEPSEKEKLEMALSENIKRNDLNIYEKIAFVLQHVRESESFSALISKRFVREVKT